MERFGNYVLLDRVGMGGMAEVHRGLLLGRAGFTRMVAIKRILPHLLDDPAAAVMLVEEARLAATLQHPNIVGVLDLGHHGGRHFIAMDFIQGQRLLSVRQRAGERGGIPPGLVVWVMRGVLEALAHAHGHKDAAGRPQHVIHRDISPDNVMVTYNGGVLIMDFGVARAVNTARLTSAGTLRGKPGYLSPEVVAGVEVTQQADLYAAGVVMHELLCLRPMREAENEWTMLAMVQQGSVPRFEERGVDVAPPLADVVYRALHVDPAARFPDARAFLDALQDAAARAGIQAWGAPETAAWMALHFASERDAEQEAQRRFEQVAAELRGATTRELDVLMVRAATQGVDQLRQRRWRRRAGWAAGVVAGGAVGLLLWSPPAPTSPTPVPPPVEKPRAEVDTPPPVPVPSPTPEPAPPPVVAPETSPAPATRPAPRKGAAARQKPAANAAEPSPVRSPAVDATPGRLVLQSKPWGRVSLDGKDMGLFTPTSLELAPGRHRVDVVNPDLGVSGTLTVEMEPGGSLKQSVTLK